MAAPDRGGQRHSFARCGSAQSHDDASLPLKALVLPPTISAAGVGDSQKGMNWPMRMMLKVSNIRELEAPAFSARTPQITVCWTASAKLAQERPSDVGFWR